MVSEQSEIVTSKYQKIAVAVAQRIANGDYEVGEKLKSRTTIASTFNVSPETARKGLNILADLQILTLKHGSGAIILSKEKAIEFLNQYETSHSVAILKGKIRDNIKAQQQEMEELATLVDDFLLQTRAVSKQYPLAPYEIIVSEDSEHLGKSIGELNVWHQTGATIVAIEHEGKFIVSPGPFSVIEQGDHIFFVGDEDVYARMKTYFNLRMGLWENGFCHRYQIPYFVDEVFNYATYQASKIPFIAYVDPQKRGELLEVSKIEKPIKMVLYFGDQLGRADQMLAKLNRFGLSSHFFHEFEKCLYINPIAVDKGKATKKLFGNRFIAFGNDKNDISMFDAAHYSVQVGDFDELTPYANLRVSRESVHEGITTLFEKYKGIT